MTRATVIGAGSWGTAFATVLADAGTATTLCPRREALATTIRDTHENPDYLAGFPLPADLRVTSDPAQALHGADLVAVAVPSQTLRANLEAIGGALPPEALVVSLMKGVELGSRKRMTEVIVEVTGIAAEQVAVVTGPNLAAEIAARYPAATVVACADESRAQHIQKACTTSYFRPYTNTDVVGCELGGAVKNVIALACGIAGGIGFGDNTMASLITRGLAETARLGVALGADPMTFAGLAGMGDLVATCTSPLSRNRTFGERLGQGLSVEEVIAVTAQTAEGVKSCTPIVELAREHDVDMPIAEHVAAVVAGAIGVRELVQSLMSREVKAE